MLVRGIDVRVSDYDGLPVKNHLPESLEKAFKTRRQWLALGYVPGEKATAVPMHPNLMHKKLVEYFHEDDVKGLSGDIPRNCLTCVFRSRRSFCVVAGDYVGEVNCCSEYEPKFRAGVGDGVGQGGNALIESGRSMGSSSAD